METTNSKLTFTAEPFSTPTTVRRTDGHSNERCRVQNYLLVWLDPNVTTSNEKSQHTLQQLRNVINDVNLFIGPKECVHFLEAIEWEKIFLIVSGSLGQDLVPRIHSMTQIAAIYIHCEDKSRHEEWVKEWPKVNDVYTQIKSICEALEGAVKRCNRNSTTMSFAQIIGEDPSDIKLNQLEPSFMYTQLFKKTLLDMEHDREKAIRDLVKYYTKEYATNSAQLKLIGEFGRDYRQDQAIWWYTRQGFTYQMLNRALRLLEADNIVNMGFFIRDLHHQIQQLHNEQVGRYGGKPFLVYRGQALSISHFEKLEKTKGGLMSFNCFLSTSTNKEASEMFAETDPTDKDTVGILFVIEIEPNILSTPFADVQSSSQFSEEDEILFSMPTVFRIGSIEPMHGERRFAVVNLTFTTDDDMELRALTDHLDTEDKALDGWERMVSLLIKVGQPVQAEELCYTLLAQSSDPDDQSRYWDHLGTIKDQQGEYSKALSYYEKGLEISQKSLPDNHPDLATSYNNIGSVHDSMGGYSKALFCHERALEIWKKSVSEDHPSLATSYNNIGSVYDNMGEYSKALSFYEKDLEISQKILPANHPSLATSYNSIGSVCDRMGEYSKALSFYERSLEIRKKSLPGDHHSLATSCNNIASVYKKIGEYSKALSVYEQAQEILKRSLPDNHPDLATSYNNIGLVYKMIGEYSKALSFYEQALDIFKESLPDNHPSLATSYNNIGSVYDNMGEHSKALFFYERALDIKEKSLPDNHPSLATSFNNIGSVCDSMGEYSTALSFYERALEIWKKSLPGDHPSLATSYNNIGSVHDSMGEYSKALSFYERALEIQENSLPANHPNLLSVREDIEALKFKLSKK